MNNIRVVLIEDHALTRVGLKATLDQANQVEIVGEAATGLQGLKLLESTLPDVAIVDIGLPDIDGIELTRRFKKFLAEFVQQQTVTKVMMLTMQGNENSVLAAFAAGADSYCMKDASLDRLIQAIQSTYEGNSWVDPSIAQIVLQNLKSSNVSHQTSTNAQTSITGYVPSLTGEQEQILSTYPLTQRELDVMELIVDGCSNAEIAEKLYITVGTVKTHVRNILNKLCVNDRTQAAVMALRSGLVS